jgi:hypothetical protein
MLDPAQNEICWKLSSSSPITPPIVKLLSVVVGANIMGSVQIGWRDLGKFMIAYVGSMYRVSSLPWEGGWTWC